MDPFDPEACLEQKVRHQAEVTESQSQGPDIGCNKHFEYSDFDY